MNTHVYDNWKRIKEAMEASGNIKNDFYRRACVIIKTGVDPQEHKLN